ncbi:MAG: hypothetical protein ABSB89_05985 [Candidatus Bathyarchaeia archaeon]
MGMMRSVGPWTKVLSNLSSIVHVLVTVFFGYLISLRQTVSLDFFFVAVFVVTSKLFSIVFAEDRSASKKTIVYSTIVLALLILLLTRLSTFEIIMGLLILVLYSLYPLCNGKAPFDVLHHALRYIFLFILGFGSQAFWNESALMTISAIVLFSLAGELLAGLAKGSDFPKSAASLLGTRGSLTAITSLIFVATLISSFVMNNLFEFPIPINGTLVPFYVIPALAIDLYLTIPLMRKLNAKHVEAFHLMRRKEVAALVVMSLVILVVFQTGRIGTTVTVNSTDYSFNVGIRTFIAGPHSWDVPWIVFNYVNEDNYYYVVFHKEGALELSQKIDGQLRLYVSSCATQLTPFEWHNFQIVLNATTVTVELDGKYRLTTPRELYAENSSIIISPTTPNLALWIACSYRITLINETDAGA